MHWLTPEIALIINAYTPPLLLWMLSGVLILYLLLIQRKHEAIIFFIALTVTMSIVGLAKIIFAVPRPVDALVILNSYASPSGHAASGAFLATMLMWLYLQIRKNVALTSILVLTFILTIFVVVFGYVRVVIGVHTWFQVIAGFAFGTLIPLSIIYLTSRKKEV